jgi:hypothetical protein
LMAIEHLRERLLRWSAALRAWKPAFGRS